MRLIIREYLALLKESKELDRLLPDLLLSMSIPPISHAQIGVRQAGVDVAAVGKDPGTGKKTLFLFVIKQGDMGRSDWNNGQQAVRPSLDEVKDVYLNNNVSPIHIKLPKKVIVCTGGDLKQDCQQDWTGYIKSNEKKGILEFDFWGGSELSVFIEKYLFNENALPSEFQSKFRKTLSLLSDSDYDFSDYYSILDELLLKRDYGDVTKVSVQNKILKSFRTINLCQNIIFFWSKNEDNLRPAICCSERTVLNAWDLIRRYEVYDNKKISSAYLDIYGSLIIVYNSYAMKVKNHCYLKNGFSGSNYDYILECALVFENLGFLSTSGLLFLSQYMLNKEEGLLDTSKVIVDMVKNYIINQKSTYSPCYDGNIIDISEAIYLLHFFQEYEFIDNWIKEMINSIAFAYTRMNKYFPIHSDNFDDIVDLNCAESVDKKKLFELSTLIPILSQWCVLLNLDDTYLLIQKVVSEHFPDCTMQIWYPDEETDSYIYNSNASHESGNTEAPVDLSISIDEMKERIHLVQDKTITPDKLSSCKNGLAIFPIISSRHFRTPFLPLYWQSNFVDGSDKGS
ncbi:MAG: hypothetical protein OQK32_04130 [Gammaproteobacteria bacterium]|nr:hypothetical protein [Gammaproteobacteria bacterium]MCW8922268.1 hypothetical protein [Gammaproteobacteria bacterium]